MNCCFSIHHYYCYHYSLMAIQYASTCIAIAINFTRSAAKNIFFNNYQIEMLFTIKEGKLFC